MVFLETLAKARHQEWMNSRQSEEDKVRHFQFDEMETFVHSKCLPLSILLAVETDTRKIVGFRVCSMPAKGPLAAISREKYGPRKDERSQAAKSLFSEISSVIAPNGRLITDKNPKYPSWLRPHFPKITHVTTKGQRGCVVGQGELKKIGFDPLFSLNHTAAMFRANINRLARRTWCTTKRVDRLIAHLALYVDYHNQVLTGALSNAK